jgi:hypothetical protein
MVNRVETMNVGICGCRPSVKVEGMKEAAELIVKNLILKRYRIGVLGALGFSMDVMRVLQHKGGMFDLYLWDSPKRMTRTWMEDDDKQVLQNCIRATSGIIIPKIGTPLLKGSAPSKQLLIEKRDRMFAAASDTVIIFSPAELDGDCAILSKISKQIIIFKSLDDVKAFRWETL